MTKPLRIVTVTGFALIAIAVIVWVVVEYFLNPTPSTINFSSTAANGEVHLTVQTDPQNTITDHPDWVSYFVQTPQGKWVRSTYWKVPANTDVAMTIMNYDSCTPLRNPAWGGVTGVKGGVAYVDGKATTVENTWSSCTAGHTFTIPGLNVNIPLDGVNPSVKNACAASPCAASTAHNTTTFIFHTPKKAGNYRWQCIIPCGGGFIDGFGGPMSTEGFMTGFIEVA